MIRLALTAEDIEKCKSVRAIVYQEELGISYELERDSLDARSVNFLFEKDKEPVATARIIINEQTARIDRLAVRKNFRLQGIAKNLIDEVIKFYKERGLSSLEIVAFENNNGFLKKLLFKTTQSTANALGKNASVFAMALEAPLPLEKESQPQASGRSLEGKTTQAMDGHCAISGEKLVFSEEELSFFKKMEVPEPRIVPVERARKRMAFANQRTLFWRECAGSGKKILSNYPPESKAPVFDISYWFSDNWDMHASGRDFDFNRPFFEQYAELMQVAPRPNLQRNPQFDENSDYTNYAGKNKNCYLIFDSDKNWDCLLSYSINSCQDVVDCFRMDKCELCCECIDCSNCYGSAYLQNCDNCSNSYFLKNCIGCADCFGCVNLKNKRYCFLNKQLKKEDYLSKVKLTKLNHRANLNSFKEKFIEFAKQFPQRFMQGVQNEDVVGDYLTNCKNSISCFDSRNLWDCTNIQQAFDDAKNCQDCTEVGDGVELLYECCYMGYKAHFNRFCTHVLGQSSNLTYCYFTPNCADCFGCIGLRRTNYCILNKKYSKEQYKELSAKIIDHMKRTNEWGEFFPAELSPFPYNLTHAHDYLPLEKQEALSRGYTWRDPEDKDYKEPSYQTPETIAEVSDTVISEMLACANTGKNYRIQKKELSIYRKLDLPLPSLCPDERHLVRLRLRNPRKLHKRECATCKAELMSTIAPDRPELVLCEEHFQKSLI